MTNPELSRRVALAEIPGEGLDRRIVATAEERDALMRRFDLPAIHAFAAQLRIEPWMQGGVRVHGRLDATVEQTSVVSLDRFEARLSEPIERILVPEGAAWADSGSTVVDADAEVDEPDLLEGEWVDLGEIAAEAFGLALDPYPRKSGESFGGYGDRPDGREAEDETHPFAALKDWHKQGRA